MLSVGLTGGIGSGKSTVADRLVSHGATLVDSDRLAREVVAGGTEGLAAVVDTFGDAVLDDRGELDRAALAALVFGDDGARRRLEGIVHPLVRRRAAALAAEAGDEAIVVNDIPLLTEIGTAPTFDLVVVVETPERQRLDRLAARGMDRDAATARMAAQAGDDRRRAIADVLIDNSGDLAQVHRAVDALWHDRLVPFADNKRNRTPARRPGPASIVDYDPRWPDRFRRLADRLRYVLGDAAVAIDHIGSTSVPGLPAKDVIDVQIAVSDLDVADGFADRLGDAGFPAVESRHDNPKAFAPEPGEWHKRFHAGTDPGNLCHLHVRRHGAANWYVALAIRDRLRADPAVAADYAALKRRLAGDTDTTSDYARRKEPWFERMWDGVERWVADTGWRPGDGLTA
ncbi:dephospho-CoA kinase [Stackebrandtia albiflava]|uniref:Dephospho-CoA kinase n=1 Tax=Stackebrandtia albiflava TaxID=406432 RepID=A0A562VCU3_9ACTN|nr:dephospho-CoA kinase [Stackebrandtia albiflava]TWJ15704.1 dephospho-CoA kinase [Stackebrandtia albiflava]